MLNLTKADLTLEEYRVATFFALSTECHYSIAEEIEEAEHDGDQLNDAYESGDTIRQAVDGLIAEYREFNGLNRKPIVIN